MKATFLRALLPPALAGMLCTALVDSSAKAFAILAVVAILSLALSRATAAIRHLLWLLAMAATLVLPALSLLLPAWSVLPAWMRWEEPARTWVAASTSAAIPPANSMIPPSIREKHSSRGRKAFVRANLRGDGRPAGTCVYRFGASSDGRTRSRSRNREASSRARRPVHEPDSSRGGSVQISF